jgi:hypothetical protein
MFISVSGHVCIFYILIVLYVFFASLALTPFRGVCSMIEKYARIFSVFKNDTYFCVEQIPNSR